MSETYIDSDGSELTVKKNDPGDVVYCNTKKQVHRLSGPAIECANGDKYWYQNNQLHRLDGPAAEWGNGSKRWIINGNGGKYWYVEGERVEPSFLVAYWLEKGRCCWYDESSQELCFSDS